MVCTTLVLAVLVLALLATPAMAHPLGNFTTNTSAAVLVGTESMEIVYVLDLAEIPTQQTAAEIEAAGGDQDWAGDECRRIAEAQQLLLDGVEVPVEATAAEIRFPEGEAGLDTLRLTCSLTTDAVAPGGPRDVVYADDVETPRAGWREVIAVGNGTTLINTDVPDESATDQLRDYPDAEVSRTIQATLSVDPSRGDPAPDALREADFEPVAEPAAGLERLVESYTDLIARQNLTPGFVILAILLAIALGTAHAVAPGHGKTVIAAYLLGEGGQAKQALALGGTVAITHTIGVLLLGLIVQTSTAIAPESLYPILGAVGGALFTGLGILLLYRAVKNKGHSHDHGDHTHDHAAAHDHNDHEHAAAHDHSHDGHSHATTATSGQPSWRMLVVPGLAGGMVPSPSALLVLLGGIGLGRTWFGVLLVIAYGIGMALALVGAGYLLHRVRFRIAERLESTTWARVSAALPLVTSSLIIVGGLVIVARSFVI